MNNTKRICQHGRWNDQCSTCKPHVSSESALNDLLCGCDGMPIRGAVCGYVIMRERCGAPDDYDCEHKHVCRAGIKK